MISFCQPLPQPVAEEMLQVVTRALCDRPGDSAAQRDSRTRQMVHATLGCEPRDGLEYMLSTLTYGHFQLILDSMHDVFLGQIDTLKAKTKTTIVALDRAMLELMKELRTVRRRPLARSSDDARREEAGSANVVEEIPPSAPLMPERETMGMTDPVTPAEVRRAEAGPAASGRPEESRSAKPEPVVAESTTSGAVRIVVSGGRDGVPDSAPPSRLADSAEGQPLVTVIGRDSAPSSETGEGTFEEHLAAFEAAMATVMETLEEARGLDSEMVEAASGD